MSDSSGAEVRFTTKELLMEIRADVRAIDAKLELKADRERVHDLANRIAALELLNAGRQILIEEFRGVQLEVESLKGWRNRIVGAVGVVALFAAAIAGRLLGIY